MRRDQGESYIATIAAIEGALLDSQKKDEQFYTLEKNGDRISVVVDDDRVIWSRQNVASIDQIKPDMITYATAVSGIKLDNGVSIFHYLKEHKDSPKPIGDQIISIDTKSKKRRGGTITNVILTSDLLDFYNKINSPTAAAVPFWLRDGDSVDLGVVAADIVARVLNRLEPFVQQLIYNEMMEGKK